MPNVTNATFNPGKQALVWDPHRVEVPVGEEVTLTCSDGDFVIVFDGDSPFPDGPALSSQNKALVRAVVKGPGTFPFRCALAKKGLPGLANAGDEIVIVPTRVKNSRK